MIVQELPALMTKPETQVPPAAMEKVPPAVPTLVIVGVAVSVRGPAPPPAAVLLTVMVPVSVAVLGVAGANVGVGALNAAVPPVVTKPTALVVPIGVVTVRFLVPFQDPVQATRLR